MIKIRLSLFHFIIIEDYCIVRKEEKYNTIHRQLPHIIVQNYSIFTYNPLSLSHHSFVPCVVLRPSLLQRDAGPPVRWLPHRSGQLCRNHHRHCHSPRCIGECDRGRWIDGWYVCKCMCKCMCVCMDGDAGTWQI